MRQDEIKAIGIDANGSLWVQPKSTAFPFIYREAMEVRWNPESLCLYGPKPREWSYAAWFGQIRNAAREQGVELTIGAEVSWSNIDADIEQSIRSYVADN